MSDKNFHVKRERTDLDPRQIVGGGYGEFEYVRYKDGDRELEMWSFETETFRSKFIKDYGGREHMFTPPTSVYYGAPYYGCPPADPDCDFGGFTDWCRSLYLDPAHPGFIQMPHTCQSVQLLPFERNGESFFWDRK